MILLTLLAYAVAELATFLFVADKLGWISAILLVVAISATGPFLVRRAGIGVLAKAASRLASGEAPTREVLDGVVLLIGGFLVCIPGFLSDLAGLALIFSPIRRGVIKITGRRIAKRLAKRGQPLAGRFSFSSGAHHSAEGDVIDVESYEDLPNLPDSGTTARD